VQEWQEGGLREVHARQRERVRGRVKERQEGGPGEAHVRRRERTRGRA
jgi:hypothetical protein